MTGLVVIAGILGYAFVGGAVGQAIFKTTARRCDECHGTNRYCMHEGPAVCGGVGWPLALPVAAGFWVANYFTDREEHAAAKAKRAEAKHQRRIAELQAQQELAREQKEKTLADIRFLVENGIHADVPGLYDGNS